MFQFVPVASCPIFIHMVSLSWTLSPWDWRVPYLKLCLLSSPGKQLPSAERCNNLVPARFPSYLRLVTLMKLSLWHTGISRRAQCPQEPHLLPAAFLACRPWDIGCKGSGHSPGTSEQLSGSPVGGCFWTVLPLALLPEPASPLLPDRKSPVQPSSAALGIYGTCLVRTLCFW